MCVDAAVCVSLQRTLLVLRPFALWGADKPSSLSVQDAVWDWPDKAMAACTIPKSQAVTPGPGNLQGLPTLSRVAVARTCHAMMPCNQHTHRKKHKETLEARKAWKQTDRPIMFMQGLHTHTQRREVLLLWRIAQHSKRATKTVAHLAGIHKE